MLSVAVLTEDGHVSLEWITPTTRIALVVNFADHRLKLYATDVARGLFVDESFPEDDWAAAFGRIRDCAPLPQCYRSASTNE